jgi:GAF domain-containing protein
MSAGADDGAELTSRIHGPTGLAALLADLAVQMHAQPDPDNVLPVILDGAVKLLPGISWAGVAHVRGTSVVAQLPTDEVARRLNDLQNEVGDGPAISALNEDANVVVAADLSAESRWSGFVDVATKLGVQCLMVFRLFVQREVLGVLTIYGPTPNMFTSESIAIGEVLAQHAAVALAAAATQEQLHAALASRDTIGQAKGILMARDGISGLQAFAMLVKASQETNLKLTRVAQFVVDEHEQRLPPANN